MIVSIKTEKSHKVHEFIHQVYDRIELHFPYGAFVKCYNEADNYLVVCGFTHAFFGIVNYIALILGMIFLYFYGVSYLLVIPALMYLGVKNLSYAVYIMFKLGLKKSGYNGSVRIVDNEYTINYLVVA